MEWIKFSEKEPNLDKIHFLVMGDSIYIRGTKLQPFLFQLCGQMRSLSECLWTHWCELPSLPESK